MPTSVAPGDTHNAFRSPEFTFDRDTKSHSARKQRQRALPHGRPWDSIGNLDLRAQGPRLDRKLRIIGTTWFDIALSIFGVSFGIYAVMAGPMATTVIGGTLIAGCACLLAVDLWSLWRGRR